jgi:Uma2 family endonuclease
MCANPLSEEIEYPYSDGQPLGESDLHIQEMVYLLEAFRERFRALADAYVAANMFFYFEQGNRAACVAPDLFVVRGTDKRERKSYLLWREGGRIPCLTVEVTSEGTQEEDLGRKKRVYEQLGAEEYFLFDPLGEYLRPRLQGFRLIDGRYRRIEPAADGSLTSRTTGVVLRPEGSRIRAIDHATGELFLRNDELHDQVRELRAEKEAAEEELARLRRACAEELSGSGLQGRRC